MMAPIPSRRVQRVYQRLLAAMERGTYPAQSLLPPSRTLCREYGVSRPTLGKAVAQLVAEGRLRTRQGAGTLVLPAPTEAGTGLVSLMCIAQDALLVHAQRRALAWGFLLNLFFHQETSWDPRLERRFLACVKEQRSLALLAFCSPLPPTNDDMLAEVAAAGVRVIHIDPYRPEPPAQEYLLPDYRRGGFEAATRLVQAGCRQVRVLGHWLAPSPSTRLIEQGVAEAVAAAGGCYRPAQARQELLTAAAYVDGTVRRQLAALPAGTGLVYTSLQCAAQAQGFLAQAGRTPEEVRLLGVAPIQAPPPPELDCLVFDSLALLERVLAEVARPGAEPLRELVAPVWQPATVAPTLAEATS